MGMEKRGQTTVNDIRELIKTANNEEKILVVNLDGFLKFAGGKDKPAVVILATGDRATMLREFVEKVSE